MGLPMEDLAFQPKTYNSFENKFVQLPNRYIQLSQFCQKPSCAGWLDGSDLSCELPRVKQKNAISELIRVLSCLVVAFALVVFPPISAHAATGIHGGHFSTEQGNAVTAQPVHFHVAASQSDCGASVSTSKSDTSTHQCCASMCFAAILIDEPMQQEAKALRIELAMPHALPVAAETTGFLRPPNHLI